MPASVRPQLRSHLGQAQDPRDPDHVFLIDRLGLAPRPLPLTPPEFLCLEFMNGENSLREIQAAAVARMGGLLMPLERVQRLVQRLDEHLLLDTPRFRQVVDSPIRPPRCIGAYEGDPDALRNQLADLFLRPGGPGLPAEPSPDGLVGALLPHMDYRRGNATYAWGFKEVFEKSPAALFVIVGTSHYSGFRFTLTRKDFRTPLGVVPTDQDFIDRLLKHYSDGLFADEWQAHFPEHSIELEVVLLQWLYEGRKPIRIVPLVVGSFHDALLEGSSPTRKQDIAGLIEALGRAAAETPEPICWIISGDLAHIGPKFGAAEPVTDGWLDHSRRRDLELLQSLEKADAGDFFRRIAQEKDQRNICGLSPAFTVLTAASPARGKVLHYQQFVHPQRTESVSFASVGFYG